MACNFFTTTVMIVIYNIASMKHSCCGLWVDIMIDLIFNIQNATIFHEWPKFEKIFLLYLGSPQTVHGD